MIRNLRAKLDRLSIEKPAHAPALSTDCQVMRRCVRTSSVLRAAAVPQKLLERMGCSLEAAAAYAQGRVLFLDTETTGLSGGSGTLAFLVGLGWWQEGAFMVEQLLMRDYHEEIYLLERLQAHLTLADVVVTFNGRSFDLPLLRSRFVLSRMEMPQNPDADILHMARRVYRARLARCTLQALENRLLDIYRTDDLPGAEVPKQYFTYLKTQDPSLLTDILRHNAQDIETMPLLMQKLADAYATPHLQPHVQDRISIARVLERQGALPEAEHVYRTTLASPFSAQVRVRLSDIYRRQGRYGEAAHMLVRAVSRKPNVDSYIRLAKLQEHKLKNIPEALASTQAALDLCTETEPIYPELIKRLNRLEHKQRAMNKRGGTEI